MVVECCYSHLLNVVAPMQRISAEFLLLTPHSLLLTRLNQ